METVGEDIRFNKAYMVAQAMRAGTGRSSALRHRLGCADEAFDPAIVV